VRTGALRRSDRANIGSIPGRVEARWRNLPCL